MTYAVISDIHGNKEALKAVLKDIEIKKIKTVYCLGDLVGYGPDPLEVIRIINENVQEGLIKVCLKGNHESYVLNGGLHTIDNSLARVTLDYSRNELEPTYPLYKSYKYLTDRLFNDKKNLRNDCLEFIRNCKDNDFVDEKFFSHGSPVNGGYSYIEYSNDAYHVLTNVKHTDKRLHFIGHTHLPFFSSLKGNDFVFENKNLNSKTFEIGKDQHILVNIGSVGQPRDCDWRACYVIGDDKSISHRRVEYRLDKTREKLEGLCDKYEKRRFVFETMIRRLEAGR